MKATVTVEMTDEEYLAFSEFNEFRKKNEVRVKQFEAINKHTRNCLLNLACTLMAAVEFDGFDQESIKITDETQFKNAVVLANEICI